MLEIGEKIKWGKSPGAQKSLKSNIWQKNENIGSSRASAHCQHSLIMSKHLRCGTRLLVSVLILVIDMHAELRNLIYIECSLRVSSHFGC